MDVTLLLNTSQRSNSLEKNESENRSKIPQHEAGISPSTPFPRASFQATVLKNIAEPRRYRGRVLESHSVPRSVNTIIPVDPFTHRRSISDHKDDSPLYEISGEINIFASQILPVHEKHLIHDVMFSLPSPVHAYLKESTSPAGSTKSENDISSELGRRDVGRFEKTHTAEHNHRTRETAMASLHGSPITDLANGLKSSGSLESRPRQHSSPIFPKPDATACDQAPDGNVSHDDSTSSAVEGCPLSGSSRRFARPKMRKRATSAPDFAFSSNGPGSNMAHTPSSRVPFATGDLEQEQGAIGASPDSSLSSLTPEPRSRPHSESPIPAGNTQAFTIQGVVQRRDEEKLAQVEMQDGPWEEPCCMFVKDCNTGSQLRKAISHLFGRNKSCTLRIPKKVWVYYCRKHYQRVRYRNAKTYPLNQMELVRLQIRRLQSWSVENQRNGSGPYIKNWTLSLRKREQNRLDQSASASADNAADDEDGQIGPPAPEWLLQRLGSGYTTEQMMDVAKRLHDEIKDSILGQVPEIEFLPDIVDPEEGVPSRPSRIRKQSRPPSSDYRPLKRKASSKLSDLRPNTQPTTSPFWRHHDLAVDLSEKRARTDASVHHSFKQEEPDAASDPHSTPLGASYADGFPMVPPILPGVEYLDHVQGHSIFMHSHDDHITGTYDQDQPTSSHHHHHYFGPESPQAGFRWTSRRNGHIRLPSINAQLPLQESEYSISPARPFLRGSETSPGDQDRLRLAHHQRSNTTPTNTFAPFHQRSDPSSPWLPGPRSDAKIVASPVYEYASPSIAREPWPQQQQQHRERGFAPSWENNNYHRVANAAPPAQHHQLHHFQHASRREEHSPPVSTYSWRIYKPETGDD